MGYESFPPQGPKIQCSGGTNYYCIKLAEWNNQNSLERVNFVFAKPLNIVLIWNLIASMILADLRLGYLMVFIVDNSVGRNPKISVYVLQDIFPF